MCSWRAHNAAFAPRGQPISHPSPQVVLEKGIGEKLGLSLSNFRGNKGRVVIDRVFAGYPAERMLVADFILTINGTEATDAPTATKLLNSLAGSIVIRCRSPSGVAQG